MPKLCRLWGALQELEATRARLCTMLAQIASAQLFNWERTRLHDAEGSFPAPQGSVPSEHRARDGLHVARPPR